MNVFLSIKHHPNGANRERISKIVDLLARHKMEAFWVASEIEKGKTAGEDPEDLMRGALKQVRECKLMVIDLTEKGVGVGVEAGYAYARGIPIITVAQGGFEVSESVAGISREVFYYRDWNDLDWFLGRIERNYVPASDPSLGQAFI